MARIAESELVLNPDGSIYHLNLLPEDIAGNIITVGDPARVAMVSKYFDEVEVRKEKREFVTHTGRIGKKRLTVISTGIGPDNIDITLNELDALANIDLYEGVTGAMSFDEQGDPTKCAVIIQIHEGAFTYYDSACPAGFPPEDM